MLDLLIAILISLGCSTTGTTKEEISRQNPEAYERANTIINSGGYRYDDGGGIVIVETGGD